MKQQLSKHNQSNQKSTSQQQREPQTQSLTSPNQKNPTYTQVSIQSASASNLLKFQNLSASNKQIQPILKQKEDAHHKQSTNSNSQSRSTQQQLTKNNSGPLDKKEKKLINSPQQLPAQSSQTKGKVKGSTFTYQEQQQQQKQQTIQQDGIPNRQLFKKSVPNSNRENEVKNKQEKDRYDEQEEDVDEQFIEVIQQDEMKMKTIKSGLQSNDSYKLQLQQESMRPSDEVQYQELIMEQSLTGSLFKGTQNNNINMQQYQSNNSQFSPIEEVDSQKYKRNVNTTNSDQQQQQYKNVRHLKVDDSGFKVHEEVYRGDNNSEEDRIIPISESRKEKNNSDGFSQFRNNEVNEFSNNQVFRSQQQQQFDQNQQLVSKQEERNSDIKKFNMEEDFQNQQQLRIMRKELEETKERQKELMYISEERESYYQDEYSHLEPSDTSKKFKDQFLDSYYKQQQEQQQQQIQIENENQEVLSPTSFSPHKNTMKDQQREHILSFADKNQLYIEYPGLQQFTVNSSGLLQSESNMIPATDLNFFRPLSPTAVKQQQRLQDILRTSQGDISQLQTALQSQKIDEQQLNNMIDLEKNYVIMQYENILQQLNIEFHKLLSKNKDTEEQLSQKEAFIKTQSLIISDREESLFQQEQQNRQLKNQLQDMVQQDSNKLNTQKTQLHQEVDNLRLERELQDQKIHTMQGQIRSFQSMEEDLREQLESMQNRLRIAEQNARQKEELSQQIERERQKAVRDLKNLGEIDAQMKEENKNLNVSRLKLEDQLQEEKQKVFQLDLVKRQRENDLENLVRDNRSLKGTIEIMQQSNTEFSNENQQLKEQLTESERQKLLLRGQCEKGERELKKMQNDYRRSQSMLQEAQDQIEKLMFETQNNSQRKQQNIGGSTNLQQQAHYNSYRSDFEYDVRGSHDFPQKKISEPNIEKINENKNYLQQQQFQRPLQEQNQNQFNPNKLGGGGNYNTRQQSPANNTNNFYQQNDSNQKNNIVWLSSSANTQQPQAPQQQYQQMTQQTRNSQKLDMQDKQAFQRKKTHVNQNESQLNEFFQWPNSNQLVVQNQNQVFGQVRSLERPSTSKQAYVQSNQPQQNMQHNQEGSGNVGFWNKGKSPLNSFSNQQNNNNYQSSYNNKQSSDQEMPAAGKKTIINSNQSPLPARNNKNQEQQLLHMQNSLSALQMEKEMLENEFRRIGGHPKNKQQIEKKQQVELELDIVNNNIQGLKQKLRELNAF